MKGETGADKNLNQNLTKHMTARLLGVSRSGRCPRVDAGGPRDPLAGPKDAVMGLWADGDGAFGWRRAKAGLPPERSQASGCPVPNVDVH